MISGIAAGLGKIVDLLIQMSNRGKDRNIIFFQEVVNPLFSTLETVHKDYLRLLQETAATLVASGPRIAADKLEIRRLDVEPTRAKLWAAEAALNEKFGLKTDSLGEFAQSVRVYLEAPIGADGYDSWTSQLSYVVLHEIRSYAEDIERLAQLDSQGIHALVGRIEELVEFIRAKWVVVASKYEILKVEVYTK